MSSTTDTSIIFRTTEQVKNRLKLLARRMGFKDLSKFMDSLTKSILDEYGDESWESGYVYVVDGQILGRTNPEARLEALSFPLVAPSRFWRYCDFIASQRISEEKIAKK